MEQYKVILVDDEVEVIDIMEQKIRWNDLGFDVVGSATNGVKALELVEKLQPDVVLTDIKMPYMDGLELARKLNQDYPNIYIMLCTGFDEFEYAKEAVHLEIKEYMLKPISATELSDSLVKLKNTLDKEREEKLNVKKLEDYFQEVLPKLQSNFFISLIEGRVGEEDYERFLQNYRVDMKGPLFCCIIFHTSENDVPDGMNPLLLSMSVEREVKQRLTENCNCQEFIYMGNTILIMELHSEEEMAQLTDSCDRFCRWAWRIMGAAVTAGIGTVCNSLHDISISYEGAREAVSYRVLYGTKRAINIAEIVPKESKKTVPLEETRMQDLFRAIHVGDREEIRKEAIKEIEKLHKNADTISQYNLATMEIVSGFFKFCANNSMDFNDISGNVQNLYERVTQLDETSMTNWIINMSAAISEKLKSTRNSTSRRMITDAQNIVKQRYMEPDISLDEVCADLGVSLHKNADTISQYNLATMEIVSGFFKFCANNSMDFNDISGNVQNLYERVTQLDETSMTNWIINMSAAISEKLKSTRNSTSRRMITDAQNIVKQRYMEPDISLDEVCADLGVSNSYFSSIFKKETGQPFVTYLTDYRMDRAEELVLNTDEKSYKIAEKVGYQDANYFSYVFKKKFGVSPSKYRASGKKENEK